MWRFAICSRARLADMAAILQTAPYATLRPIIRDKRSEKLGIFRIPVITASDGEGRNRI
jgi:hypothetical protein